MSYKTLLAFSRSYRDGLQAVIELRKTLPGFRSRNGWRYTVHATWIGPNRQGHAMRRLPTLFRAMLYFGDVAISSHLPQAGRTMRNPTPRYKRRSRP